MCHEILECDVAWKSVTLTSVAVGSDHTRAVWGSEDRRAGEAGRQHPTLTEVDLRIEVQGIKKVPQAGRQSSHL